MVNNDSKIIILRSRCPTVVNNQFRKENKTTKHQNDWRAIENIQIIIFKTIIYSASTLKINIFFGVNFINILQAAFASVDLQ